MGSRVGPSEAVAGKASERSIAERATIRKSGSERILVAWLQCKTGIWGLHICRGNWHCRFQKGSKIGTWIVIVRGAEVLNSSRPPPKLSFNIETMIHSFRRQKRPPEHKPTMIYSNQKPRTRNAQHSKRTWIASLLNNNLPSHRNCIRLYIPH